MGDFSLHPNSFIAPHLVGWGVAIRNKKKPAYSAGFSTV